METAHYLNRLVETCAPENAEAQDAIDLALLTGKLKLTYDFDTDCFNIATHWHEMLPAFRAHQAAHELLLIETYGPLIEHFQPPKAA